jgi:hypothetical protein
MWKHVLLMLGLIGSANTDARSEGTDAVARTATNPLPDRMLCVVPWGDEPDRARSVNTIYLTDGWTPQLLRERLRLHEIDTLRVIFQSQMLDHGIESRWFSDIRALSDEGFRLVIAGMTSLKDRKPVFQPYDSRAEGHLPIADRTPESAPTWTRWIADWKLVAGAFADDPNVIGFEMYNEFSPANESIGPGALYMRDIGGWLDAVGPLTLDRGKYVWFQGLWATTSFGPLRDKVDDRGRSIRDHIKTYDGKLLPSIHVYNWYGPEFRRPESIEQAREASIDEKTPTHLREALASIANEPDATRAMQMLHQYNFDRRYESTAALIDEARSVCGLDESTQIWMSETGVGVTSFTGDAEPDRTVATQYRAIIRACNTKNVSVAFWVDRGTQDGWGFFVREANAPGDPRRDEYRQAFFDRQTGPIDFLSDPKRMSVIEE